MDVNRPVVRPLSAADLDAVAQLESACFADPWTRAQLAEELDNPQATVLVAVQGGAVIGYAGMHCVLDEAYITNVAVSPRADGCADCALHRAPNGVFDARSARVQRTGHRVVPRMRLCAGRDAPRILRAPHRGCRADDPFFYGKIKVYRAMYHLAQMGEPIPCGF